MAESRADAWYFIYGLLGRQPVQFGPYPDEVACLTAIASMEPILVPPVTSESRIHHWQGPRLAPPIFVQLMSNLTDSSEVLGLKSDGSIWAASAKPEHRPLVWVVIHT